MSLNRDNVHYGPARIFLGVTNPASGDPPTAMAHVAGVPTPGTEVGFTQGDTILRKTKETGFINAEQAMGPIGSFMTAEGCEVEFTALERVYTTLQAAFDVSGMAHVGGRMLFYSGGLQSPLRTQSVMISSPRPNFPGKYEITVIYMAFNVTGYEVAYRRSESSFRITLRGLFDTSRTIGDQLFQHAIEE